MQGDIITPPSCSLRQYKYFANCAEELAQVFLFLINDKWFLDMLHTGPLGTDLTWWCYVRELYIHIFYEQNKRQIQHLNNLVRLKGEVDESHDNVSVWVSSSLMKKQERKEDILGSAGQWKGGCPGTLSSQPITSSQSQRASERILHLFSLIF